MQKKLIAMAVAGMIAAPAFAQSNVTVYGIIDTFLGYAKAGDTKFTGVANGVLNGPRIGFKGEEDLGNGLKAKFVLEQGFNSDDASPASSKEFHRQAWVGLEGGFGFVGIGRQYSPGYYAFRNVAVAAGALDPFAILTGAKSLQIDAASDARWDNSVSYMTKSYSGFSAHVIHSFGSTESDTLGKNPNRGNDDKTGLGLNYANGPLNVDYIYVDAGDALDQKEHYVGATYDFGGFKLVGSYQTADLGAANNEVDVYQIGGIVPVGKGNIHVAYGARNEDVANSDSRSFSVAYTHNLSKRTIAYVGVNRTTNDSAVALGALATQADESSTAFGVGLRHAF